MKKRVKKSFKTLNICCFLVFLLGVGNLTVFAQQKAISGTVIASDGLGVPGANVMEKGTKNVVTTDFDGKYTIKLKSASTSVLVFTFVGYKTEQVVVGNKSAINVTLKADAQDLDEVVVIGYGTAKKSDVLGSIASVKAATIAESTPVDAVDAIQGRIAGVQILNNGGPGAGSDIQIRGTSTFKDGAAPLYVVDGQQMDNIDNIDPSSIVSMEILKDGASAAIYGSKSANGVILISTKSGKSGVSKIEVNYTTRFGWVSGKLPVANTKQKDQWLFNNNGTKTPDSLSIRLQQVVDIQKLLYKMSLTTNANVAVSGGGENSKFYWNNTILNEEGVLVGTSFKRVTSNLKVDFTVNKRLTAGTRANMSYDIKKGTNENRSLYEMSYRTPDALVLDYDGSYIPEQSAQSNPLAIALETVSDVRSFIGNSYNYFEYAITPSLKFKTTIGVNYELEKSNNFKPAIVQDVSKFVNGSERDNMRYDIQQENYFNYNKKINKHSFTGLLGASTQKWRTENLIVSVNKYNNEYVQTTNNALEYNLNATGSTADGHSLASFFGRMTYDYDQKYLLAATYRRDGSSRFGSDHKWGNFPSLSLGWRISNEKFLKKYSAISEIKLRASYAVTGNERIGNYDSKLLYSPNYFYNAVNGIAPNQMSNDDLRWESTTQYNYGLDLAFFKRRLNISVDSYVKTTTDLLYDVPVPQETGFSTISYNVGSVENRGIEVEISGTPISTKNFKWISSFNISNNKNKVLSLFDENGFFATGANNAYKIEIGQSVGNMFGYGRLGVYPYNESNAYVKVDGKNVQLTPNFNGTTFVDYSLNGEKYTGPASDIIRNKVGSYTLLGGDINYEDLNGDGIIDSANDRKVIGNGLPDYTGGFYNRINYKQFSLGFLFNFNIGNDIYRYYDFNRDASKNTIYVPGPVRIEQAWTTPGQITDYPASGRRNNANSLGPNSYYVNQGDFIKLKYIKLGYSLSKETLKSIKNLASVNFSLTVNNLLTLTNYIGYNPELGNGGNSLTAGYDTLKYPNKSDIIFGLNVTF